MIHVLQVNPVSLAYLVLGGFVVIFSSISLLVKEKLYIGEVVVGTIFGIIIGPYCANIFNPHSWGADLASQNRITLEVMRIVLATGLFAIGVELPKAYMAEHVRSLTVMVVPTMAYGWLISAVIIHSLFPALTFVSSLAISACLTPTDPVLASAIVGGNFAIKNVPGHLRRILSAEAASNDGLAYPFLSISVYLAIESNKGVAFRNWILVGWLYQVILGTVLGAVLGFLFSYLLKISHRKGWVDRESFTAQYLAFAFLTIGIASTLGSDDLLAAFAAGTTISWDGHFNYQTEEEAFTSIIDLVLNCASFMYIGAWLPFDKYNAVDLGIEPWRLVVLFIAILFLRRIPCLLLLYRFIPDVHGWREALFCGHFGPIGVGAVFISTLALSELPQPSSPPANQNEILAATMHPIVSFIVLCSIMIHGLSIPAFWFGRRLHTRTLSLTSSFSRTATPRGAEADRYPEWMLNVRRAPAIEGNKGNLDIDLEGRAIAEKTPSTSIERREDTEKLRTQGSSPQLTRRSSAKSKISDSIELTAEAGHGHRPPTGSLEHGVRIITDGKEETVGHGYASLANGEDQRNAQNDSPRMSVAAGDDNDETPVQVPKTVTFAQ